MALSENPSNFTLTPMIRSFRLFLLLALVAVGACDPVSLTLGAGAATGVAAYQERGIEGVARDGAIEARIFKLWVQRDKNMVVHMSIEVYESRALLTGVARSEQERADAVGMAWKADGIKDVMNEIVVGEAPSFSEVARDTAITAELKSRLTFDGEVLAVNYAIETVRGVVFLLGIAQDQAELDRVIAQARNISYVRRVVSYVQLKADIKGAGA
ncbi:MAG: BON domain-containing protein [Rhodospirillaceae bacterium]|jgi:osmotically-inducible protein OsmY|nr:BON domain-containing protein [Rhodospirillaceae bacterium]MBT5243014.1 BON domain-containing protein [Rhodospirillaceae bacterium]MBT6243553.1 BON domain-containing protein [Rhodospirillaceae bacterium]